MSALEGLALSVWRIDAAAPADGHSVRVPSHVRRGGDACRHVRVDHRNQELQRVCAPTSPASPWAASRAKRGAAKTGTCLRVPRHGPAPGRRTAKGVSYFDSAVLAPGNEGLSKFDSAVPVPSLREARAPGRPRAASSWSPSRRRPPGEDGRGSPGDSDDASYSPPITLRTVAGSGTWRAVEGVALGRISAAWPFAIPSARNARSTLGIRTSAADGARSGSGPAHSGSYAGPFRRSAPVALEPPVP